MTLPDLRNADVKGKKILVRLDLDVPVQNGTIEDDVRLKAGLGTVQYLLDHGATVIIAGHLGRPEGVEEKYSLEPIAKWFSKHSNDIYHHSETHVDGFPGWELSKNLFLLENLRFYKGEEANDPEFAKQLASIADIYVNDAFAVSHRDHASIIGVARLLPHYAGIQLQKEVEVFSSVLSNPKRPLVVIVGGAKIETKLPLIEKMHQFADFVLVGGKIAEETRTLLKVGHEKVPSRKSVLLIGELNSEQRDITDISCQNFVQIIEKQAKTVIWNGTMGKINSKFKVQNAKLEDTERSTVEIARAIVRAGVYSIVGGGDTVGFLDQKDLLKGFNFVSTGGGAMLSFLAGEKLPGIEALE